MIDEKEPTGEETVAPVTNAMAQYLKDIGRYPLLKDKEELELKKLMEAGCVAEIIAEQKVDETKICDKDITKAISTPGGFKTELWDSHKEDIITALKGKKKADLPEIIKKGKKAKDRLVTGSLRFVIKQAKGYATVSESMSLMDIIQEGNVGLINGIEHFDYMKGFSLLTYCSYWIRQSMERGLADKDHSIRVPVHAVTDILKIKRFKKEYYSRYGMMPDEDEIMESFDLSREKYTLLTKYVDMPLISLNSIVGSGEDTDTELGELLPDTTKTPEEEFMDTSFTRMVTEILNSKDFTPRERYIFSLRFGLNGNDVHTLESIARSLGITRERVRQIEAASKKKLKCILTSKGKYSKLVI